MTKRDTVMVTALFGIIVGIGIGLLVGPVLDDTDAMRQELRLRRQAVSMAEVGCLIDERETERIWLRDVLYVNVDDISDWEQAHRKRFRRVEGELVSLHAVRAVLLAEQGKMRNQK